MLAFCRRFWDGRTGNALVAGIPPAGSIGRRYIRIRRPVSRSYSPRRPTVTLYSLQIRHRRTAQIPRNGYFCPVSGEYPAPSIRSRAISVSVLGVFAIVAWSIRSTAGTSVFAVSFSVYGTILADGRRDRFPGITSGDFPGTLGMGLINYWPVAVIGVRKRSPIETGARS